MKTLCFSENFRAFREKEGLTQKAIAQSLEVSPRTVSQWEKGEKLPTVPQALLLSQRVGVPVEDLFYAEDTAPVQKSGMESLTELYKIGSGPSSSHTMGPEKACILFKNANPTATRFEVTLYGSLAKTGEGHGTDRVILKTLAPTPCEILWDVTTGNLPHPNTMELAAFEGDLELARTRVFSVGGGAIRFEGEAEAERVYIYSMNTFNDIASYCKKEGLRLWEYVYQVEGPAFREHLMTIWKQMKRTIAAGLEDDGILPGGLNVHKKAKHLYNLQHVDETAETKTNRLISAYAFAVGEQNACGELIVTAPTCGAAGVVPAVMYFHQKKGGYTDEEICRALATGGLIGNLIKTNASISGAECGCQAEVGSACAMAAACLAELLDLSLDKIEYSAEIAIEHHLGLTCDPICGLVQIPCIERNAVAAMRAINAVNLSSFLSDTRKISLDKVIITMGDTGRDLHHRYRETSEGGLAKIRIH
ncbi:MAG: L-serine ammonia-lyase, iron-sulfur-dependent, subunit alpha [Clostridia bacterium]|nr:L-serine ammonia-lyase, iron-sulfur-dependent, subunit alpha [Clostridia bacterium]